MSALTTPALAVGLMMFALAMVGFGQEKAKRPQIASALAELRSRKSLVVESPVIVQQKTIPVRFTGYGDNVSPPLNWSDVPANTKSLALILEDPDAKREQPWVHWLVYNIPADAKGLPEGIGTDERLNDPKGALQGKNTAGKIGYFGPKPPRGDQAHHYHFQVFALDTTLDLKPGADRNELVKAMSGHVLAAGELVGIYQAPVAGQ